MFLSYRRDDAVLSVCQDNATKSITIQDLNGPAEEILGFPKAELLHKPIQAILPARIHALLDEYVEYDHHGKDVGDVLSKVQSFCLVDNKKHEVAFRLKVARNTPVGGHARFSLVLQSAQTGLKNEAFRKLLQENFKGHEILDPATGLPDRASIIKDLEFVSLYVSKSQLTASVAVMALDNMKELQDQHAQEIGKIFQHIASICKKNLRGDDTLGFLAPDHLVLLLFDINDDSTKMVLNRLRWLIAASPYALHNKSTVPFSVSIAYRCVKGDTSNKNLISDLESFITSTSLKNTVQEMPGDFGLVA